MNGGAKVPGLEVKSPRGIARARERKVEQGEKDIGKETEISSAEEADQKERWIQGRVEASKRNRTIEGRLQRQGETQTDINNNGKRQRKHSPVREEKEGRPQKEKENKPTNFLQVLHGLKIPKDQPSYTPRQT